MPSIDWTFFLLIHELFDFRNSHGIGANRKLVRPTARESIAQVNVQAQNDSYGQPDEKFISTSHIERQNLIMRMHMRRFTRLTSAFSKKLANHCHTIALHFVYYNFVKIHKTFSLIPAPLIVVLAAVGINEFIKSSYPEMALSSAHLVNIPVANSIPEFASFFTFPDFRL